MNYSSYTSSSSDYEVIQIVSCDDKSNLSFNARGFKRVLDKIPNIPIVVISVAGKYRIGKSFLINSLIPALEFYESNLPRWLFNKSKLDFHKHGSKGFEYKCGKASTTKGIHLLNKPFVIPNPNDSSKNVAILLMDSQGLDAIDVGGGVDQVLFSLTNFLSSHVIYNVKSNIEPTKLLSLIALASHSKNHCKDIFCSLDVLVRDYAFTKTNIEEMKKESENYVKDMSDYSGSIVAKDFKELQEYFRFVKCYPLPHPGRKVETKKFEGDKNVINNDFIELLYDYIKMLFDKQHIVPKCDNGKDLLQFFETMCSEIIEEGNLNVDEFYRQITDYKDNKIINNFITQHFNPLKTVYLKYNECDFNNVVSNVIREYKNVKNNVFDKSKLDNINFYYEIRLLENKYKGELERKRLDEVNRRLAEQQKKEQEELRQQQIEYDRRMKAKEENLQRMLRELNYEIERRRNETVRKTDDKICVIF